ncbi:hypothetical protein [Pseudomonas asplenii]|uniref:hypothetical protein n=1 Tax=Pseudomonas asplenii TaxID=53407 RepID=UPI00036CEAB5|nr:hypothetical protein [Pseudomonas fuscovaginae]
MDHTLLPAPHIALALGNFHYPQHHLLPVDALTSNLALDIETAWPDPAQNGQVDHMTLLYTSPGGNLHEVPVPLPGPLHFPLRVWLPYKYLHEEGVSKVAFKVRNQAGVTYESDPVAFTIDLRVPNHDQAGTKPVVDGEVGFPGVTRDYLLRHCNSVKFLVEQYPGQTAGDRVGLCLGGPNEPVLSDALVTRADRDTIIRLDAEYLLELDDGVHLAYYKLFSRAGKVGPNSKGTFVRIDLGPRD